MKIPNPIRADKGFFLEKKGAGRPFKIFGGASGQGFRFQENSRFFNSLKSKLNMAHQLNSKMSMRPIPVSYFKKL